MIKLFSVIIAVALLCCSPSLSGADVDLSGMTFEELVALREQLNMAIWNSQEWQEVTVPAGVWIVGQDIPAGHWTITPAPGKLGYVTYCEKLDAAGKKPSGKYWKQIVISSTHGQHDDAPNQVDFIMEPGWAVITDLATTFTPYTGKPDLGFK